MLGFMCAFGHFTTPFQLYRDYLYYLSRKARKLYLSDSVSGETHGLIWKPYIHVTLEINIRL